MVMKTLKIWRPICQRWLSSKGPVDPRYVFSRPPNNEGQDGTHFFTNPQGDNGGDHSAVEGIGEAIARQRRQKRVRFAYTLCWVSIAGVLGYSIGYRVMYRKEQSFLPLMPASRIHKLNAREAKRIGIDKVKVMSRLKVLEQLSQHEMIKEQYGVPLLNVNTHETPNVDELTMWREDSDPCVTGVILEPDDDRPTVHSWYRLPYICKWRLTHRPINIHKTIDDIVQNLGLTLSDVFQIITPDRVYGSFKYEYPRAGDDHYTKVWFLGEMKLSDDSLIIYKGKFHSDVTLDQIHLLRRENGEIIRYILYKKNE